LFYLILSYWNKGARNKGDRNKGTPDKPPSAPVSEFFVPINSPVCQRIKSEYGSFGELY
jgi:hypothetical protein